MVKQLVIQFKISRTTKAMPYNNNILISQCQTEAMSYGIKEKKKQNIGQG